MGCIGSKPPHPPVPPSMPQPYPGQTAYPQAHGPQAHYPPPPEKQFQQQQFAPVPPAQTNAPHYYPPPPQYPPAPAPLLVHVPVAPSPSAPPYFAPPPLDVAVPPQPPKVSAKLKSMLSLDCNRIGWLAVPSQDKIKDYVYRREVMHTGHLLDTNGNQVATICDVTPHAIDPTEGLPLSGKATFGKYTTDDHEDVTLGCLEIPAKFANASSVAITIALRVKLTKKLQTEACLFYAGDGWGNHLSIKHYRGMTKFEACPGNEGRWESRVEVGANTNLEVGKILSVVAVMQEDGEMSLWVDGDCIAKGAGLKAVDEFQISKRNECFVGRWMRPDQSLPTHCNFFNLDIYDGAMSEQDIKNHHQHTSSTMAFKPQYAQPPVVNFN